MHDQATGQLTIHHATDLVELVETAGPDGLTAKAAAAAVFDKAEPTRGEAEKARRKLDKLVAAGELVCVEGAKGRGATSAWFLA